MDINAFFPTNKLTDENQHKNNYKEYLFKLVNKGYLDTLKYTYFIDFCESSGSICGINRFIEQVNNLYSEEDESNVLLGLFKNTIIKIFGKFFKYEKKNNEIRINRNIRYHMTRLSTIDLTNEQKIAIHKLYEFLIDDKKITFGLYGYAGSGKTTTMVEFVSYLIINRYINSVTFAAPTNKAVNVIKSKFRPHIKKIKKTMFDKETGSNFNFDDELDFLEQNSIDIKFMTIHKLLMFQSDYSVSGEMIFVRDRKTGSLISQYDLVIIDECSMINTDMVDNIFEEIRNLNVGKSKSYKKKSKIIFTGDPAQLPPVNEENSSIFCKNSKELDFKTYADMMNYKISDTIISDSGNIMKHRYRLLIKSLGGMDTFLLKTVVRSKLDNVTQVCNIFRKWIKRNKLPNLRNFFGKAGVYFYNNDDKLNKIKSEWFTKFLKCIKNGENSIIVTWTNKQTNIYNETIRRSIFRGKKIKRFEINDILMLSEFYGLDLGEDFVKQRLYTSEQIKVLTTKMTYVPINSFEPFINCTIKKMKNGTKIKNQIDALIKGLNDLYCTNTKLMCWILKVHKFGEDSNNSMTIIVVDDDDKHKYDKMKSESGIAVKNFAKQLLQKYRSCPKQIEKQVVKPLWKQWNKLFVEPFASVNYGYSITCHKAQGSSFYDAYVDIDDILQNNKINEAKRCAYTAVTRASNELHILI